MGNTEPTVLQAQPNGSNSYQTSSNKLKSSKPGSKTIFKYINPVEVDETE
jgi:hypothetical protein